MPPQHINNTIIELREKKSKLEEEKCKSVKETKFLAEKVLYYINCLNEVHDEVTKEENSRDQYINTQILPSKEALVNEKINIVELIIDFDRRLEDKKDEDEKLELNSQQNLSSQNKTEFKENNLNKTTNLDGVLGQENKAISSPKRRLFSCKHDENWLLEEFELIDKQTDEFTDITPKTQEKENLILDF